MTQTYKIQVSMNQAHLVESGFVWKQGDFGFNVEIEVLDFDATGSTPQIIFRKSNGAVEATTITVSGNKYTYTLRGTELDTPGPGICDLKLKNSTTQRISTASFKFFVIPDTEDGLNQQANSYSDTIAQIVDGFEEEVDAVRKTFEHTTKLISSGKNLFNKNDVEEGYYVNYEDGQKYENANYCIFYSPIGENVKLTTGRVVQLAFFDEDGQYISGDYNSSNVSKTFTTPADTAYMWVSVKIADLNIFQIEIGETVTAYEPYYNQFTYKPAGSDIVVALDGSGDYTKITDALNYCLTHPDTTVYVKEGTYDFITELGNTYFANFDYVAYTNMGPKIGNGTKLIMSSGAKITCHYTGDNADVLTGFSPLNAYLDNKGFTLDNVTIECSRVRYCVHDDVGSELSMYKNVYQNCHFVINNTLNAEYQSHCTLGGGLGVHGEIEIKNCIFESLMGDGIYSYAVSYHNSAANTGNEKSRIVFEGNVVKGIDTVQFTDHGTSTLLTPCLASNNNLGAAVRHTKTNAGVPDNMEVLDWNNYVRPQNLEEVSGNPISFSDSAIDHSAINPVITLEPIQDLHGYDKPWPAGGGKNKLEVTATSTTIGNVIFTVNSDGTVATSGTSTETVILNLGTVDVKGGTSYILNGCPSGGSSSTFMLSISGIGLDDGSGYTYTPSEDTTITIRILVYAGVNMNGKVYKPMIRLATESDATFAPYSNICPISGYDKIEVLSVGVNLLDKTKAVANERYNDKGTVSYSGSSRSVPIRIKPSTTYYFKNVYGSSTMQPIWWLDAEQKYISNTNVGGGTTASGTAASPANAYYVGVNFPSTNIDTVLVSEGQAIDYVPYIKTTDLSENLPQTVYGGSLDLRTGVLTVDMAIVDLGDYTWTKSTVLSIDRYYTTLTGMKNIPAASIGNLKCSHFVTDSLNNMNTNSVSNEIAGYDIQIWISTPQNQYADAAAFKTAMDGVYLVYELATPVEIQLTPHELKLAKGYNYIYTNGTLIELTYIQTASE